MNSEKKETRGGARPNAGRKRKGEQARTSTVSFVCTNEQKKQIAENAKKMGVSKSVYICNMLFC